MKRDLLVLWLLAVVIAQLATACRGCSKSIALAVLESEQGNVQHNRADNPNRWSIARVGAEFQMGDALRTLHASIALLQLEGGGRLHVKQDTVIRFQNRRPAAKRHDFDVETGQVLLEASDQELLVETSKGVARIGPNSQVLIRKTAQGLQFEVTVGKAQFEEEGTEAHAVEAGQSYIVKIGSAVIDRPADAGADSRAPSAPNTFNTAAQTPDSVSGMSAQITGRGVTQKGPSERSFRLLSEGSTTIAPETTVQVDASSSIQLERGSTKATLAGVGRYTLHGDRDRLLEVHNGKLSIAGASRIIVPGGVIEMNDDSAADVQTLGKNRTRLHVTRGQLKLSGAQGSTKVSAGEEATLDADGSTKLEGQSLNYADLTIDAGDSLVVHDPRPPTVVRIAFASLCREGGTVRVQNTSGGQFASGTSAAALRFAPGRNDYVLHCLGEHKQAVASRGSLTILRDSGVRPVPTSPPSTAVNVDGRNYTVMYQNQLPSLTVTWPNAPDAAAFRLHVESPSGKKTVETSSPSHTFRSGALPEGHHTVYFEGENKVSRRTGIDIAFDNAAPMASLSSPGGSDAVGGEVTIAGVALPGWQVEIGGAKVTQDAQQRFSQKLQALQNQDAIAVKLIHPTRGVHVYLRRTSRTHD